MPGNCVPSVSYFFIYVYLYLLCLFNCLSGFVYANLYELSVKRFMIIFVSAICMCSSVSTTFVYTRSFHSVNSSRDRNMSIPQDSSTFVEASTGALVCSFVGVSNKRCSRAFATRYALLFHLGIRHSIFMCDICSLHFASLRRLDRHLHSHVNIPNVQLKNVARLHTPISNDISSFYSNWSNLQ